MQGRKPRRTKPMASCISSPSVYRWSISACLHFPSVMRDLSCAWPGCGEEAEEILTAAPQSSAAVAAKANLANDTPPCCVALPFAAAFASSSEERVDPPSLAGRLRFPEGESAAMVSGRECGGSVRRGERRASGG